MNNFKIEDLSIDFFRKELVYAMKQKDVNKKECIQNVISAIKNKEIDLKKSASTDDIVKIMKKETKQLNETISLAGSRDISEYKYKLEYLSQFIPEEMSKEDILKVINDNCNGMNNKGIIMKTVVPILKGKADNKLVSECVDLFLSK